MDSSPPHKGRKESTAGDQSSTNKDSSQQNPPPPVAAPPHMMHNYPPGMGYSGNYQNPYPPPPAHGYAPYPNQPPNGYNYPPQYYGAPPPPHRTGNRGRGFCRGFIMCSCLIFTTFLIATIFMALVLRPQLPLYNVTSLSVANFNTAPSLTGDWNISIMIENPNDKLRGFFSDFKVELLRVNDVAVSSVSNFMMEKKEKKQIDVRASSNTANGMLFQKWDLDLMAKERESGSVTFGLRVSSMTVFKSNWLSTRNSLMSAVCSGLKVVFQNNTGSGMLDNGGKPVNCQLFVR